MPIQDLQRIIDESVNNATGFSRELFAADPWSAPQIQNYVNGKGSMSVATIDRTGRPHAAVVAAGCVDGVLYIAVTPRTALLGNLRRSNVAAFTVGANVSGRGTAAFAGRASDLKAMAHSLPPIMREAIEQDAPAYFYTITPERIFATGPEG